MWMSRGGEKLTVTVTVKLTKEELADAKRCIAMIWPDAPVSQSAMIRYLMKRGCGAVSLDTKMRRHPPTDLDT